MHGTVSTGSVPTQLHFGPDKSAVFDSTLHSLMFGQSSIWSEMFPSFLWQILGAVMTNVLHCTAGHKRCDIPGVRVPLYGLMCTSTVVCPFLKVVCSCAMGLD